MHKITLYATSANIFLQFVSRLVDHSAQPQHLQSIGRYLKSLMLSRALSDVLQHRVYLNRQRVVVQG